jgi:hypothetical protein
MGSGLGRHAGGARCGILAAVLAAMTASGCNHSGAPTPFATARNGTLAFESIDGPPAELFHKLVQNLEQEAQTRQLAVVSREGPSQYRARGYLAAHIARGRTSVAWVWDVYDTQEQRILRISGEEPVGRRARDAWNTVDDAVLRKIARASLDELAALLATSRPAPAIETEPAEPAIALAAAQP